MIPYPKHDMSLIVASQVTCLSGVTVRDPQDFHHNKASSTKFANSCFSKVGNFSLARLLPHVALKISAGVSEELERIRVFCLKKKLFSCPVLDSQGVFHPSGFAIPQSWYPTCGFRPEIGNKG